MRRYLLVRMGQAIISLLAVSILVFLLGRLSGDPLDLMLSIDATPEDRAAMSEKLGLDKPLPVQYGIFIRDAAQGDFGTSLRTNRSTMDMVEERFPATLQLSIVAMIICLAVALPIGVYSAKRRGGVFDFAARLSAVLGQSVPSFWLGIMFIYLFAVTLGWLPSAGRNGVDHLILPALTLAWGLAAGIMRLTRSSMLDVLDTDYVKLARIKGAPEYKVLWKHAFKNASLPVLTYSAMIFIIILGNTVVIETVFAWPGVGRMVVEAVTSRDFPVVQTVVMLLCALFIFTNLAVDIIYGYINPKIRYGRR